MIVITTISNSSAHQWLWRRLALLVVGNNPLSGWFWCRAGRQENTANQCSCQNDKKTKKIRKKRKRLGSDKNTMIGILKMVKKERDNKEKRQYREKRQYKEKRKQKQMTGYICCKLATKNRLQCKSFSKWQKSTTKKTVQIIGILLFISSPIQWASLSLLHFLSWIFVNFFLLHSRRRGEHQHFEQKCWFYPKLLWLLNHIQCKDLLWK